MKQDFNAQLLDSCRGMDIQTYWSTGVMSQPQGEIFKKDLSGLTPIRDDRRAYLAVRDDRGVVLPLRS